MSEWINGLMTLLLIIIFLGIWVWAWSSKNKVEFNKMAHLPLEDTEIEKGEQSND